MSSESRPPKQLPIELLKEILDCIDVTGDNKSLSSCALVCHAWTYHAWARLFTRLTIIWDYAEDSEEEDLEEFPGQLQKLADGALKLSAHVQVLCLSGYSPDNITVVEAELMNGVVHCLPKLHSLDLRRISFNLEGLWTPSMRIETIVMHLYSPIEEDSAPNLSSTLSLFPRIGHLYIKFNNGIGCRPFPGDYPLPVLNYMDIGRLSVVGADRPSYILYEMIKQCQPQNLTELHLLHCYWPELVAVGKLIPGCFPHIRSFSLNFSVVPTVNIFLLGWLPDSPAELEWDVLNLSLWSSLESVTCIIGDRMTSKPQIVPTILAFVHCLPTTTIRTVSFHIGEHFTCDIRKIMTRTFHDKSRSYWTQIDDALLHFPNIGKVRFDFPMMSRSSIHEEWLLSIDEYLPGCKGRGLIQISASPLRHNCDARSIIRPCREVFVEKGYYSYFHCSCQAPDR